MGSLNSAPEQPGMFEALFAALCEVIEGLRNHQVFDSTIEVLNIQIIPCLRDCFKEKPQAEEAAELFILKVVNQYFFYRPFPLRPELPAKFIESENDRDLKRAASLTLNVMEILYPQVLIQSKTYRLLDQRKIRSQKTQALADFSEE